MTEPDLPAAASAVDLARSVVHDGIVALATAGSIDDNQVLAYDVAHAAAAVETARTLLDYGAKGDPEARITCAFVADAIADLVAKLVGREQLWGTDPAKLAPAARAIASQYPADHVSLYLNTLLCQDPETWKGLEGLPELA